MQPLRVHTVTVYLCQKIPYSVFFIHEGWIAPSRLTEVKGTSQVTIRTLSPPYSLYPGHSPGSWPQAMVKASSGNHSETGWFGLHVKGRPGPQGTLRSGGQLRGLSYLEGGNTKDSGLVFPKLKMTC